MEKETMQELATLFKKAYDMKFGKDDVEWKPMGYGKALAYLNWAVAWRAMKEVYPDANYRLVETPDGSPLWNINGYGMLKCAISTHGLEHIETFPIMDNRNNAMRVEPSQGYDGITARDVNDSMQRGLTKAVARFGIGLYIYEGKLETPKDVLAKTMRPEPTPQAQPQTTAPQADRNPTATLPQATTTTPQGNEVTIDPTEDFGEEGAPFGMEEPPSYLIDDEKPVNYEPLKESNYSEPNMAPQHDDAPVYEKTDVPLASKKQIDYMNTLMRRKNVSALWVKNSCDVDINGALTYQQCNKVIKALLRMPDQGKTATNKKVPNSDYPY